MEAKMLEQTLVSAASALENHIDSEINRLDNLDEDDLEKIREKRIKAMRLAQSQKQEWISKGHGSLNELSSEKELFEVFKQSPRTVCHFYKNSTERCGILNAHLSKLAKDHVETRFIMLDVEKAPFFTQRFNIRVIPTMGLFKDGKTQTFIVGFSEFGNCDDFTTEMLEWRLAKSQIINYSGDLSHPPTKESGKRQKFLTNIPKKTIRGREDSDSDDD